MAKTRYSYIEIPNEETPVLSSNITKKKLSTEAAVSDSTEITFNVPLIDSHSHDKIIANSCIHCQRQRRKSSETVFRSCSAGGTMKNRQKKSHSLPTSCSLNNLNGEDSAVLQISPEDFATQLTLMDLPVFAKISPDELASCSWNKPNKLEVTPNIVAFTKRFNQTSFWAVQEVLKGITPKSRADIISHYIRICKKLYELSNFHSLFAIISALRSAAVYRLARSWSSIPKKERMLFDKLANVFSEDENWKNLREHLDSLKLPCIPYLGMFLTDIVYVNMAHPSTGGLETEQRRFKMNNILRIISHLQQSQYEDLPQIENIQGYLNSIRYIEELQKFIDDDQFKLSLKLEPTSYAHCAKKPLFIFDHCPTMTETVAKLNLSPAKLPSKLPSSTLKSIQGHRKCCSLEPKLLKSLPIDFNTQPRHLLDDSVIEDSNFLDSHSKVKIDKYFPFCKEREQFIVLEGCLKKKIVFKHGCHPTVSTWHRFWVQLSPSCLLFYSPKYLKGNSREDFKAHPHKTFFVEGCIVTLSENPEVFFLHDAPRSKMYKFRADSDLAALKWYRMIYNVAQGNSQEYNTSNLITFE